MDVKIDVETGPALEIILNLVQAFGSGVRAEETEKAAALTEAYAFIKNNLEVTCGE